MHSLISCHAELAFHVRKVQIVIDLILLKHVQYKTVQKTYGEEIYASKGSPIAQDCGRLPSCKMLSEIQYSPLQRPSQSPHKLRLLASFAEVKLSL